MKTVDYGSFFMFLMSDLENYNFLEPPYEKNRVISTYINLDINNINLHINIINLYIDLMNFE